MAGDPDRPTVRGVLLTEADQQHFAEILSRHHAVDTLTLAELEERLEALYTATTREQAAQVVADLPPLPPGAVLSGGRGGGPPRRERPWWRRGHGEPAKAGPGWVPTNERFRDPSTNRIMRVWVDPADGARHYLPEEAG